MKHSAIALASLFLACGASTASAANDYSALFKAKKYAEAERLANAKLVADPNNADALVAKSKAIVAQGQDARFDEAARLAEQCINAHPQNAECHEAYGEALGNKAMASGIMASLGSAGKIKDAFLKAVELDPRNIDARSSLQQYYLMAPGIVGGSKSKAQAVATETAKINPVAGKLLQARVELADDKFTQAEALALSVDSSGSDAVHDLQLDVLRDLAFHYMQDKKFTDAEHVFREIEKRFPEEAIGAFGQARVMQERGKHADAVPLFEKAIAVEPKAATYYRLGQSLQALSDKAKAAAAFEKALTAKPALPKKMRAEAEEQLKALKG